MVGLGPCYALHTQQPSASYQVASKTQKITNPEKVLLLAFLGKWIQLSTDCDGPSDFEVMLLRFIDTARKK